MAPPTLPTLKRELSEYELEFSRELRFTILPNNDFNFSIYILINIFTEPH